MPISIPISYSVDDYLTAFFEYLVVANICLSLQTLTKLFMIYH